MSPLLIIFGLNGCLLQRARPVVAANITPALANIEIHSVGIQKVFVRPGAKEGLSKLRASGHRIGIWSATTMKNTEPIIQTVFPDHEKEFAFIWSRDHTTPDTYRRQSSLGDTESDHATLKDASLLWKYKVASSSSNGDDDDTNFGPHNTIFVDDEPSKTRKYSDNLLWIPTYNVEDTVAASIDPSLGFNTAIDYLLKELEPVNDVRTVLPKRILLESCLPKTLG